MTPLERRHLALKNLLELERPTQKALAYSEWPTPPIVKIEEENMISNTL
jgi:hypothetical protein